MYFKSDVQGYCILKKIKKILYISMYFFVKYKFYNRQRVTTGHSRRDFTDIFLLWYMQQAFYSAMHSLQVNFP